MGVVYRVRGPEGKTLALKLLSNQRGDRTERFAREARLQEQLGEEAGFVPLLDLGTSQAGPFLVMPLVPGGTLRARIEAGRLDSDEAVDLVAHLAEALGRAHAVGVIHRDMKPDNVLFTAEGRALVADLGLAKHFRHDLSGASLSVVLSQGGEMRGTLGYMAPEQLRDASKVGPAADVFALGAVLYECLSGRQPFEAPSYMELLARVAGGLKEPLPEDCPRWLVGIVDRALDPDPKGRYPNGAELAAALRSQSAPLSRRRLALGLAGAGVLVVALIAGAALVSGTPPPSPSAASPPRESPTPPRYPGAWAPFLETPTLRLTGEWTLSAPALALSPQDEGAITVADSSVVSLVDAPPDAPTSPADQVALTLPGKGGAFRGASFGPGRSLQFGTSLATSELSDGSRLSEHVLERPAKQACLDPSGKVAYSVVGIKLFRASVHSLGKSRELLSLGTNSPALLSAGQDRLLLGSGGVAFLVNERSQLVTLNTGGVVAALSFWRERLPLVLTQSGALYFFKPEGGPSGDPLTTPLESPHSLWQVGGRAYAADAQRLAVIDLQERRVVETIDLSALADPVTTLGLSPTGRVLALGTRGGRLLRFALEGSAPQAGGFKPRLAWGDARARHAESVTELCEVGDRIVSAGLDEQIHVWDRSSGAARRSMRSSWGILRLRPAGPGSVVTLSGRSVRIWDLERQRETLRLPLAEFAYDASLSPALDRLAVISRNTLELWALPERRLFASHALPKGESPQRVLICGPEQVLVGFSSGMLRSYTSAGALSWEQSVGEKGVEELRLHDEGRALLVGCGDGTVTLRQLPGGEETWKLRATGAVSSLSARDAQLLIGLRHGRLELWDLTTQTKTWSRASPAGAQTTALLLSKGEAVVSGSTGVLHFINTSDPKAPDLLKRPSGHLGRVRALSFSADSKRVLGVDAQNARAWSSETGAALNYVGADTIIDAAAGRDLVVIANFDIPEAGKPKRFECSLQFLGVAPNTIRRAAPSAALGVDVAELAISGDGSLIAFTGRRDSNTIRLLGSDGASRGKLSTGVVRGLALSEDGRLVAVGTREGFELWGTQPAHQLLRLGKSPATFTFLPSTPPRVAMSETLGEVSVFDPIERRVLGAFEPHAEVEAMAGTPAGGIVVLLQDGSIELWKIGGTQPERRFDLNDAHDRPASIAVDPSGRTLAVGTGRGRIALFDLPQD